MKIIYNPVGSCATSCQRLIYPLTALQNAGQAEVEVINTNDIRAQLRKADLVVLQCLIGPEQHQLIDYIHDQGKKVVIDYDDLMSRLPERLLKNLGMDQKTITENWIKYLNSADVITVPSHALASLINRHTDTPVWVLDNYIPRAEYEASAEYTPFDGTDEIRVMYSCSESHWDDFQYIGPVLRQLGETYPNVTILSQGGLEFGYHFWEYGGKTLHETKTSYGSYYSMLRRVKPHIFIAPLTSTLHNMSRSSLKYWQASVAKAAFVGSYLKDLDDDFNQKLRPPYALEPNLNKTGFLATNKSEWWSTLSDLVTNPEKIKAVGEAAYADMQDYLLEDYIEDWYSCYSEVLQQ